MNKQAQTSTVKFLFARGRGEENIVEVANQYCMMTPCRRVKLKLMPNSGAQGAITALSRGIEEVTHGRGIPNAENVWMAAVEQYIPSTQPPIGEGVTETIQIYVVKVTDGNLDALEKKANEFARDHIVIKHDIMWDSRDPKVWMDSMTFVVRLT